MYDFEALDAVLLQERGVVHERQGLRLRVEEDVELLRLRQVELVETA